MRILPILILSTLTLLLLAGCTDSSIGNPPFTFCQLVSRTFEIDGVTPASCNSMFAGDYNGWVLGVGGVDGNSPQWYDSNSFGGGSSPTDWNDLSFPTGCPAGEAVQIIGATLTCVAVGGGYTDTNTLAVINSLDLNDSLSYLKTYTDTNWQTSWTLFDANLTARGYLTQGDNNLYGLKWVNDANQFIKPIDINGSTSTLEWTTSGDAHTTTAQRQTSDTWTLTNQVATPITASDLIPTMTSNTAPSGVASASSEYDATYAAWKVFNNNTTDRWTTASGSTGWIQYQFTSGQVITQYTLSPFVGSPTSNPKSWQLLGSNDASNWTTLDTQTNTSFPSQSTTQSYTFSNSNSYTYYRLNITANGGDSLLAFSEMELKSGTTVYNTNIVKSTVSAVTDQQGIQTFGWGTARVDLNANPINIYINNVLKSTFDSTSQYYLDNFYNCFGTGEDSCIWYTGNDTNWNLRAVGTGNLNIQGGNVQIDNNLYVSQRVGIGTTTPATNHKLDVTDATSRIAITSTLSGSGASVRYRNTTNNYSDQINGGAGGGLSFFTGGQSDGTGLATRMTIDQNGTVGIGTNTFYDTDIRLYVKGENYPVSVIERNPANALNVTYAVQDLLVTHDGDMGDGFGGGFNFNIRDNAGVVNPIGAIAGIRNGADNSGALAFITRTSGSQNTRAILTNDGNLGIGTTTPSQRLDVNGTINVYNNITHDDTTASDFNISNIDVNKDLSINLNVGGINTNVANFDGTTGAVSFPQQSFVDVYMSGSQTIASVTEVTIAYNTEVYDRLDEFNTTTYTFTAKNAGVYNVTALAEWANQDSGKAYLLRLYNGGTLMAEDKLIAPANTVERSTQLTKNIYLSAGGTILLKAYQNTAGNETLYVNGAYTGRLTIMKVA